MITVFLNPFLISVLVLAATSAHASPRCEDLFSGVETSAVSPQFLGTLRSAGRKALDRVRHSKIETDFESSFTEGERRALKSLVNVQDTQAQTVRRLQTGMSSRETRNPFLLFQYFSVMTPLERAAFLRVFDFRLVQNSKDPLGVVYSVIENLAGQKLSRESFLTVLAEAWAYEARTSGRSFQDFTFRAWTDAIFSEYRRLEMDGFFASKEFRDSFAHAREVTLASAKWRSVRTLSEFGIQTESGGRLVLNGRELARVLRSDSETVELLVSRENIKRAAWNPISQSVIQSKIENGYREIAVYDAFLSADGFFYLLDGNHRFALDSRAFVRIKLSAPMTVSSLSDSVDAMGLRQPSLENLIRWHQGEISLQDIFGEEANRFTQAPLP